MTMPLRERFAEVEGIRLHWSELGTESEAVAVVLLHGLNNSSLSWSHVAPLLATRLKAVSPRSEPPAAMDDDARS